MASRSYPAVAIRASDAIKSLLALVTLSAGMLEVVVAWTSAAQPRNKSADQRKKWRPGASERGEEERFMMESWGS
jgi:hypothetical protein